MISDEMRGVLIVIGMMITTFVVAFFVTWSFCD